MKTQLQTQFKQQGVILIVIMVSIIITGAVYFVVDFTANKEAIYQKQKTPVVLAQAKQALIDYAITYNENKSAGLYGVLPCPELSGSVSNGRQQTAACGQKNKNMIGRLPWFTLGLPPLVDANGECLWYAVSAAYKWSSSSKTDMLNADTPGMFELLDANGNLLTSAKPEDRIVALVISPGAPINGQNRTAANNNIYCRVAQNTIDINDYLDVYNTIDNTDVSSSVDSIDQFITAQSTNNSNLNDQMIAIYQSDIYTAIQASKSFNRQLTNLTELLSQCVASYGKMQSCIAGRACMSSCEAEYNSCVINTGDEEDCRINTRALCLNGNSSANNIDCETVCVPALGAANGDTDTVIDRINLPRPAAMDLEGNDYRISTNYIGIDLVDETNINKGLFGRYMFDVSNSISGSGINNIFDACGEITIPSMTVNMSDESSSMSSYRKLYDDWKDHFFYVVGGDMTRPSTNTQCNTDCPKVGLLESIKSAVIWFSAERLNNQRRLSKPPEAASFNIPAGAEKSQVKNYLELLDGSLFPDAKGSKTYQRDTARSNDVAFCINQDLSVSRCLQ